MPHTPRLKPVRLEVNVSGRWMRVARFDADNERAATSIMERTADLLLALNADEARATSKLTARISTDDPLDQLADVLATWRPSTGWCDANGLLL